MLVGHGHPRLSEGLRDWLQASFDAVFVVADRPSLIAGAGKLQPRLVFVDMALADGDVGTLLSDLRRNATAAHTLLLSDHDSAQVDAAVLAAGADGVLHKRALATDLVDAVDTVLAGRRFATPGDLP